LVVGLAAGILVIEELRKAIVRLLPWGKSTEDEQLSV